VGKGTLNDLLTSSHERGCITVLVRDIVWDQTYKMISFTTPGDNFAACITWVVNGWHMTYQTFLHCDRFTHGVVTDRVRLLLEDGLGSL